MFRVIDDAHVEDVICLSIAFMVFSGDLQSRIVMFRVIAVALERIERRNHIRGSYFDFVANDFETFGNYKIPDKVLFLFVDKF